MAKDLWLGVVVTRSGSSLYLFLILVLGMR